MPRPLARISAARWTFRVFLVLAPSSPVIIPASTTTLSPPSATPASMAAVAARDYYAVGSLRDAVEDS